jgi:hypothetical protein
MTNLAYTLKQRQTLVRDALSRMEPLHRRWATCEAMYATGGLRDIDPNDLTGTWLDEISNLGVGTVNLVLSHANIIHAGVVGNSPQFEVQPISGGEDAENRARVARSYLRYAWKRSEADEVVSDCAWDLIRIGNMSAHVDWELVTELLAREDSDLEREINSLRSVATWLAEINGDELPTEEELAAQVAREVQVTYANEPVVSYVSPFDLFVPREARRLDHNTRWAARRIHVPIDEVRANEHYKNTDKLKADQRPSGGHGVGNNSHAYDEVFDSVTLYEFYDHRSRRYSVIHLELDQPLYEEDYAYDHRYLPLVHAANYKADGRQFWGMGDIEVVANLQMIVNQTFAAQVKNMRESGSATFVRKEISENERTRKQLTAPTNHRIIEVETSRPLGDVVMPFVKPALSADVYQTGDTARAFMQDVLGVNEFQAGGVGADRMSATAAALVEGTSTLRASDKRRKIEHFVASLGSRMFLLAQENIDEEEMVRAVGPQGVAWLSLGAADIAGEFHVTVEPESTAAVNPQVRAQRGWQLLSQLVPAAQSLGLDPMPIFRTAVHDLGLDPETYMKPVEQPEPEPADPATQAQAPAPPGALDPQQMVGGLAEAAESQGGPTLYAGGE